MLRDNAVGRPDRVDTRQASFGYQSGVQMDLSCATYHIGRATVLVHLASYLFPRVIVTRL